MRAVLVTVRFILSGSDDRGIQPIICHCIALNPNDALNHHFTSLRTGINFPTTQGFRREIPMKLVYQYMAIFFNF